MRIRGCLDHIDLYEDFSADSKNVREAKKQTKGSMEKGISAYQVGDFQKCMSFMAECAKQYPSDSIVFDYLKRSHYYFKFPPDSVEHLDMGENLLLDWNFRRRYSRKPIKLKARICGRNGELLLQEEEITVVNFSSKGLCFKSNLFFKLQETLLITLTDPALGEILKVAQVRWAETTAEGESLVGLETEALELVDLDKSNSLIASYVKAPEQAMKVLILDDDLSQCRQTRQRLKQEGIEAGYITHSKDLVEKLESDHYQVLLLDLFMPDVDGFDVMKMLKTHERWCYLPVIVMTSETSNDELINKCFQLGASDFINKPPQIKALMARLRASVNTATVIKMKTEENKDMNTKLKQLLVRSEEDSRHKAMILANMSHELRTPLNGLVSTIDLIRSFSNETEEYEQLHQLMKRSSQRLVQTVNSFLNFSDSDSEEESSVVKAFHLEHTLESSVQQMAQKYIQKSLSFSLVLDPEVPLELKGDVMRFRQCFDSILDNAFKFTLDGEVTVLVVKLDISEHKARFRVHVADTGIGFDVSKADDLFEEFVQQDQSLSRNFEGSGLGLAIAKRSCHQLKSKIECKSVLGKGSEFWFDVEFDLQIPHQKHPSSLLASEPVEEKPKSILLVEDNEDNVELVQLLLRKKPWKLSIAVDGAQGVQKVKELSFDCVLMDVNMPVMDGLTATREIRALDDRERAQVPIVALTALVAAQDRQNCFDAGMNDYLSKPIEKKDLIAKIEEWIQQT
jgi:CheY-like chemotaxis protein